MSIMWYLHYQNYVDYQHYQLVSWARHFCHVDGRGRKCREPDAFPVLMGVAGSAKHLIGVSLSKPHIDEFAVIFFMYGNLTI